MLFHANLLLSDRDLGIAAMPGDFRNPIETVKSAS